MEYANDKLFLFFGFYLFKRRHSLFSFPFSNHFSPLDSWLCPGGLCSGHSTSQDGGIVWF